MSMREYAIEMYGFILTKNDFIDFLKENNKLEELDGEIGIYDVASNYGFDIFSELSGDIFSMDEWHSIRESFENRMIFVIPFKKDNLFEKYENIEEIKKEIESELGLVGLHCSDILNHLGFLSATYCG